MRYACLCVSWLPTLRLQHLGVGAIDYSKWEKWVQDPDDPVTLVRQRAVYQRLLLRSQAPWLWMNLCKQCALWFSQEEKERLEKERQEKQDAEFEKLNPEFCGQVGMCP